MGRAPNGRAGEEWFGRDAGAAARRRRCVTRGRASPAIREPRREDGRLTSATLEDVTDEAEGRRTAAEAALQARVAAEALSGRDVPGARDRVGRGRRRPGRPASLERLARFVGADAAVLAAVRRASEVEPGRRAAARLASTPRSGRLPPGSRCGPAQREPTEAIGSVTLQLAAADRPILVPARRWGPLGGRRATRAMPRRWPGCGPSRRCASARRGSAHSPSTPRTSCSSTARRAT